MMWKRSSYDAVIIGSGPNGLSAAIQIARHGFSVIVLEASSDIGGGTRSAELTLPGFVHDVCAAVLPLSLNSPFFASLPLNQYGVEWIHSPVPLAHPLDHGKTALVHRSIHDTALALGTDGPAYHNLFSRLSEDWEFIKQDILGPLPIPPRHPIASARFAMKALLPSTFLAKQVFRDEPAKALFAGMSAHSILPLETVATSAFGLVTNLLAHTVGWPLVKGGTRNLSNGLAAYLLSLGGEIITNYHVKKISDLPQFRAALFDTSPHAMLDIAGELLPRGYQEQVRRYRYGPGVFKMDFALDAPIPWINTDNCLSATVHLGGSLEEIALSERTIWRGNHSERPYIILAQPTLFDPSRAPAGKHTVWAYCHVPNGSTIDRSDAIENQIERFAPGFRERILAKHTYTAQQMETYNANYVGGDINCGIQDLKQLFTRPVPRHSPYTTPAKNIFLCSSATPPGGGVHGMCGYFAAQSVLNTILKL
jgi:phytoene dehydrogenase-like protein